MKVADPKGEETPIFRSIWIEKPSLVTPAMVIHAIIDSDSVVGAFRFTLRAGEATIIDTECTLIPRTTIDNFGLASMSATHLLGFLDHKRFDDYRPNVSEVCGLQMLTGANEWIWRPVTNRGNLQISTFVDDKPRGFGCLVRDRDFEDYADEENRWEKRPSLWIEPIGDWTAGGIQLIEVPSQSDANDNILCFWRPKEPLKARSETAFAYRQFWCWEPPERPDLARAMRSRAGGSGKRWRFFVEFEGDVLGDPERSNGVAPALSTSAGTVTLTRVFADRAAKACRVLFEIDPGSCRLVRTAAGAAGAGQAGQRNLALPLDVVMTKTEPVSSDRGRSGRASAAGRTVRAGDARGGAAGDAGAEPADLRRPRARASTAHQGGTWLARALIFGGALAMTCYGAMEMYKVVSVGGTTPLEWALVVLFIANFSWIALAFTSALVGFLWILTAGTQGARHPRSAAGAHRRRDADLQ